MITLKINNQSHDVDVPGATPLLWVIRDVVGLTGTKFGCGAGLCGCCTVHLNGAAVRSCVFPVSAVGEQNITTIEALGNGALTPLQQAWIDHQVLDNVQTAGIVRRAGYPEAAQLDVFKSEAHQREQRGNYRAGQHHARPGKIVQIR